MTENFHSMIVVFIKLSYCYEKKVIVMKKSFVSGNINIVCYILDIT